MLRTALLVDYDPRSIARIRSLANRAGLRVVLARDGIAGLRTFERALPDVTLVQDLLPRMLGVEVCRRLKATTHGRRTPVILIASASTRGWRAAADAGFDLRLDKPFDDDSFLATLEHVLPQPEPGSLQPAATQPVTPERESVQAPPAAAQSEITAPSIPIRFEAHELDDRLEEVLSFATPPDDTRVTVAPVEPSAPPDPMRSRKKKAPRKPTRRSAKKATSRSPAKTGPKKKKPTRAKGSPARRVPKRKAERATSAEGPA